MYKFDILDVDQDIEIVKKSEKTVYNTDDKNSLQVWLQNRVKGNKVKEFLVFKSSLCFDNKSKLFSNQSLGFIGGKGNSTMTNGTHYNLMSTPCSLNYSPKEIRPETFMDVVSYFTARKTIKSNWVNQKDEYLAPNKEHPSFEQFSNDALIYSLFHIHSFQTSIRQIEYKGQLWDIKNEFFWMSKDKMKDLADEIGYDNLCDDARFSEDRYVYNLLFGEERVYDRLSEDAKTVIDYATELVEKSIEAREIIADNENHLDSWDAGYAQLKLVWKEYFPEEFKHFRQLYKNLEDRMRPLVYELGFLIK